MRSLIDTLGYEFQVLIDLLGRGMIISSGYPVPNSCKGAAEIATHTLWVDAPHLLRFGVEPHDFVSLSLAFCFTCVVVIELCGANFQYTIIIIIITIIINNNKINHINNNKNYF